MTDYKTEYYSEVKPNYLDFDENLPEYWVMKYFDRWKHIGKESPSVLGIGCGMGRALKHFERLGASSVIGVEPSDYASDIARSRGLEVITGYFEDMALDGLFDLIHIEQVLSHAPEFDSILAKARRLLKSDGLIVIEEPNDFNALQLILEEKHGKYWITPDHCNYFNNASLSDSLRRNRFEVVKTSCTYPVEFFELMGDHYLGDEEKGKEIHEKRYKLLRSLTFEQRDKLLSSYAQQGLGRDIVLFAKGVNNG